MAVFTPLKCRAGCGWFYVNFRVYSLITGLGSLSTREYSLFPSITEWPLVDYVDSVKSEAALLGWRPVHGGSVKYLP